MRPPSDLLQTLRMLWLGMTAGLVLLTAIVLVVADRRPELPVALPAVLVAALGLAALVGVEAMDRLFVAAPPPDDHAALVAFRTRFVLQLALTEAPFLLAIAVAVVLGPPWVVLVGAAFTLAALLRIRPTPARLRRFDATWRSHGVDVSLQRAIEQGDDE